MRQQTIKNFIMLLPLLILVIIHNANGHLFLTEHHIAFTFSRKDQLKTFFAFILIIIDDLDDNSGLLHNQAHSGEVQISTLKYIVFN